MYWTVFYGCDDDDDDGGGGGGGGAGAGDGDGDDDVCHGHCGLGDWCDDELEDEKSEAVGCFWWW